MGSEAPPLCGILLLDKPLGLSSNAALQQVRQVFGRPKAGHTGSLDPQASGMLPICIGEATKLAGALLAGAKGYTVELRLGERTDTGDAAGQIVERRPVPAISESTIAPVLHALHGPQQQIPPMYSALKLHGQPLYKLARRGISVERAARTVDIHALELLDFSDRTVRLRLECSKGTYVRTLVEQFGVQLGSCAHVIALRRDFVEPFRADPMLTMEQVRGDPHRRVLLPADRAVAHLPELRLSVAQARAISFGQAILAACAEVGQLRLYGPSGRFLGLGIGAEGGAVRPLRLFAEGTAGPS